MHDNTSLATYQYKTNKLYAGHTCMHTKRTNGCGEKREAQVETSRRPNFLY
jgi:hypothetical protein